MPRINTVASPNDLGSPKSGKCPQQAIATDHRYFNSLAAHQLYDERKDSAVRYKNVPERLADINQYVRLSDLESTKMGTNQFKLVRAQRGKEAVC